MPTQQTPNTIDDLLQYISSTAELDNFDTISKQLAPTLKEIQPQVFTQSTSDDKDPLELLDPSTSTARCHTEDPNPTRLVQNLIQFLSVFDSRQVHLVPDKFLQVVQGLTRLATAYQKNFITIKPIANALLRYAPSPKHLTNVHQVFIKECLLSKCYKQALQILDTDITEIELVGTGITYQDHLLYHYYGAMVYIGLKKYERALYFLKLVISAPAVNITSQIQLEAYKKFVLISLLLHGNIVPLPKYTASIVFRSIKNQCQPYQDYASAFEALSVKKLRIEFNKSIEVFKKDNNFGLAKQTLDAIYSRNIQQLTQTYLTLSLTDIADTVGLEGPNAHKIAEDRYNTSNTISKLEQQIDKATSVSERVIKTDKIIGCSKEYLSKSQSLHGSGIMSGGPGDDPEFLVGGGFDSFDDGKYMG
ncbi:6348_t:CDS:10 [Entrophospora sp. SA101]|nr:6348_t:CDS:10 [Entrophospora sp. SA101]